MTNIQNPICVPIRVDALWCSGEDEGLAPPTVDFSKLQDACDSKKPWLGDTARPAIMDPSPLPVGLHLHWTLPRALTRGTTVYMLDYAVYNELVQQGVPWSLVQSLQEAANLSPTGPTELTLDELNDLLSRLVPGGASVDWTLQPQTSGPTGLISSASDVLTYSVYPQLAWDPHLLQIYGPMIVHAAARMKLPPVPNRWLVVRDDGSASKAWVVESDRLSSPEADGTAPLGAGPTALPAHFAKPPAKLPTQVTKATAIQYLGLTAEASTWSEAGSTTPPFSPLTAVGHGVPEFAAFYPNCQGVFGFFDPDSGLSASDFAATGASYTYTIIGWFSDATNDPASASYAVYPWSSETDVAKRLAALGWSLDGSPAVDGTAPTVDGTVYCAKISVNPSSLATAVQADAAAAQADGLSHLKVAVGNTSGEALAAYLATWPPAAEGEASAQEAAGSASTGELPSTEAGVLGLSTEMLLDAAQAGVLRLALDADGPAAIENALHEQAFQAASGGWIWDIAQRTPSQAGQAGLSPTFPVIETVPKSVSSALNALNDAQMEFDRTQAYIRSQRRLLFADWCRALHLETDAGALDASVDYPKVLGPVGSHLQIGILAPQVVSTMAFAVDTAGMGNATTSAGILAYRAAASLHSALAAMENVLPATYRLKRRPAPRFFRPNDPVVLLCEGDGDGAQTSSLQSSPEDPLRYTDGHLSCALVPSGSPGAATASFLNSSWTSGPSAACVGALVSGTVVAVVPGGPSWRPLLLAWEVCFYPYDGAGAILRTDAGADATSVPSYSVQPYSTTFLSDGFSPDPAGVELCASSSVKLADGFATYNGRVVLTSHATTTMRDRILRLAGADPANPPATLTLPGALGAAASLLRGAYAHDVTTLSQALDGFHDRLLMLQNIPQVSVFDPNWASALSPANTSTDATWDWCSQSFYDEIGTQVVASPVQNDIYIPIRAGKCEVTSLLLVDAFGQKRDWTLGKDNLAIARTLPNATAAVQNAAPAFDLPPRLAQPSRLLFRWIAADGTDAVESTTHPATSPICGWVALNRVDATILLFEADGTLVGWVPTVPTGPAATPSLVLAPGRTAAPAGSFLADVLLQILQTESSPATFFGDVANALLTIEPRAHRPHTARSVLVSRPLALVRAALRLELLGTPSPHQGYEWLATATWVTTAPDATGRLALDSYCPVSPLHVPTSADLAPASPFLARETCGFTHVKFPIRLGDVSMADDGLVAYWTLTSADPSGAMTLSPSYTLVDSSPDAQNGPEPTLGLTCDPAAEATQVLLLLDPRAAVHATSGILPTKAISIPPYMYVDALRKMELLLTVGPVLTQADKIAMPLPTEVSGTWSWLEDGGAAPVPISGKVDDRAHLLHEPPVALDGWLIISGVEGA